MSLCQAEGGHRDLRPLGYFPLPNARPHDPGHNHNVMLIQPTTIATYRRPIGSELFWVTHLQSISNQHSTNMVHKYQQCLC